MIFLVSDEEPEIRPLIPKSVHFASEDEIAMFEAHESENIKNTRSSNGQRSGIPRKSSLPRRVGPSPHGNTRTTVKRSLSFDSKTRQKPTVQKRSMNGHAHQRERAGSDSGALSERRTNLLASIAHSSSKTEGKFALRRCYSDNDISASKSSTSNLQRFPLRKSNSWAALTTENFETSSSDNDKRKNSQQKRNNRGGIPRPRAQSTSDSSFNAKPGIKRWPNDGKIGEPMNRKPIEQTSPTHRKYVESKANKIEAREKALREEREREKDRSPTKGPRTPLRRTRSASEYDRKQQNGNGDKPKGILLKSQSMDEPIAPSMPKKNTSHGVKINGVYVNKGKDNTPAKSPDKKKVRDVKKSVEENEKEGARNFARCLLGILPSVLNLSDPVAVDEALQQFASDVCEAVTCMALKRKNVPNFGTLRGRSDLVDEKSGEGAMSDPSFPILNADGVYVTVYATLTLNLKLLKSGYYQKKQPTPALAQVGKKVTLFSFKDSGRGLARSI